jgi:glyoxylase-like metal-dependent hydrolase (beta-lactamase superfamily II)
MTPSIAAQALRFPFTAPQPDGELKEVAPGIRWLRMPLPYALDHINLYLMRSAAGWTIVDTGLDTPPTRALWEKILGDLDAPVIALICTHSHPDHAGLAGWLTEKLRVPLYMSRAEYFTLRVFSKPMAELSWQHEQFFQQAGMSPVQMQQVQKMLSLPNMIAPPPLAYCRLDEHTALPLGDDVWRVITGEGHSPEHSCLYNAAQRVLFSGDQLLARISPNIGVHASEPDANPLQVWLHSLERIGTLPTETLVLPAHELPFYGPDIRAEQLVQHHRDVLEKLRELCAQTPGTAMELAQQLFARRRGGFDDLLALSETLAHLVYLCANGRAARQPDASGIHRYSAV